MKRLIIFLFSVFILIGRVDEVTAQVTATQSALLTKKTSQSLLIGIIGDSMADGVGATLGPTTPLGAMQNWNGSTFEDITTTDIANYVSTRGTPYKQFALDYFNRHKGMVKTVNCARAGSYFTNVSGTDSWDVSTGDLWSPAVSRLNAAKAAAGKNYDAIIIDLGINDAQGAVAISTITAAIDALFSAVQSQFPGVPIWVIQIGSSLDDGKLNNPRQYSIRWKLRQRSFTLTDVTIVFNNISCWQAGPTGSLSFVQSDEVHLTQAGNNLLGTSLCNYYDARAAGYSQRAASEIGCILVDNPGDQVPVGYRNALATLIDQLHTDGNYTLLESLYFANGFSKNQFCSSAVSLFGPLWSGGMTWTQYRNWAFDGVDDYFSDVRYGALDGNGATTTDHITFMRLASNDATPPLNAALWGKQQTSGAANPIEMLRQNAATNVSLSMLNTSATVILGTDAVFAADVQYLGYRNGTAFGLYKGGTLNNSGTQAVASGSVQSLSRMCLDAAGTRVQFFAGKVQYYGFGKFTGVDIAKLNTALDAYVTAVKAL